MYDKSTHPHRVPVAVFEKAAVADANPETRKRMEGDLRTDADHILRASRIQNARREQGEREDAVEDAVASDVRG